MDWFNEEKKEEEVKDTVQEFELGVTHSTQCEHYWAYGDSDPLSDLTSVVCTKCWSGISISSSTQEIKDGTLVPKAIHEELI